MNIKHTLFTLTGVVALAALAGCGGGGGGGSTPSASRGPDQRSGFLGSYYGAMKAAASERDAWVYRAPGAKFGQYNKVMFDRVAVSLHSDAKGKTVDPYVLNELASLLQRKLQAELSKSYKVVSAPGPGVLRVAIAITDVVPANVTMGIASKFSPVGLAFNLGKKATTGGTVGVGSASIEAALVDGGSSKLVAAYMDRQIGKRPSDRKSEKKWENVEGAFEYWAKKLRTRLQQERTGR